VIFDSNSELRRALEIVGSLFDPGRPEPFGLETLTLLGELIGAETVGYCETTQRDGFGGYEVVTRERADWFRDAVRALAQQDPTHPVRCRSSAEPIAISDLVRRNTFQTTAIYEAIFEPLGIADSIRVYLPAPSGEARFFFFDRPTWGLSARERELLGILRGHLLRARTEWRSFEDPITGSLTERETQILRMVARGFTNSEIARRLWLSPHTVRTHLQHAYPKLGVRTRVQAARAILPSAPSQ
jgi:DNA-binding CsgD family transcriptional regulator